MLKKTKTAPKPLYLAVLVPCWILIKLHGDTELTNLEYVLVPCWILIKLHPLTTLQQTYCVLVPCWILIKLNRGQDNHSRMSVLVPCWILTKLHYYADDKYGIIFLVLLGGEKRVFPLFFFWTGTNGCRHAYK